MYVFLERELARRRGDASLLDAVTDSLILWALEGTDPEAGLMMPREDVLDKVSREIPAVRKVIKGRIGSRLEWLSDKRYGVDESGLAGGDGGAGLAAAVDGVDGGGPGGGADGDAEVDVAQVADGPGEFELGGLAAGAGEVCDARLRPPWRAAERLRRFP